MTCNLRTLRATGLLVLALLSNRTVTFAQQAAGPDQAVLTPATAALVANLAPGWSATWSQVGGTPLSIAGSTTPNASVNLLSPGRFRFRLSALGPGGATMTDEVDLFGFGTSGTPIVQGVGARYQSLRVSVDHATTLSESGAPNPFRDRRVDASFWHPATEALLTVPGYFAADGNTAETSAVSGTRFSAHLTPSESGLWHFLISAREGVDVALSQNPLAGASNGMDATSGSFTVGALKPDAPGNESRGLLRYVGEHQLKYEGTGERFIKVGADSPENWLGYFEFDQTQNFGGLFEGNLPNGLHTFGAHVTHFRFTTPEAQAALWNGKGAGILGALDYLAQERVNSIYFLTYNIDSGDGQDTWPWTSTTERSRFDVSKLAQWERVFTYADQRGIQLHVVLQELENDGALGAGLTDIRRLYFREMIARFAHHHALQWNLGEENQNSASARDAFAAFFTEHDAHEHPVTFHTDYGLAWTIYDQHLGNPNYAATSIQDDAANYHGHAKSRRDSTALAGQPWAIYGDEQGPPVDVNLGNLTFLRKNALYGNLFGGGAGVEWYFGYQTPDFGDVQLDNFALAGPLWKMGSDARAFFDTYLSVERLAPFEWATLETDDFALVEHGHTYVVYRPDGGSAQLNLGSTATKFDVEWFDPKSSAAPVAGTVTSVTGPGLQALGTPPFAGDAVAWVHGGDNRAPAVEHASISPRIANQGDDVVIELLVDDADGPNDVLVAGVLAFAPQGGFLGPRLFTERQGRRFTLTLPGLSANAGTYTAVPVVVDRSGSFTVGAAISFELAP